MICIINTKDSHLSCRWKASYSCGSRRKKTYLACFITASKINTCSTCSYSGTVTEGAGGGKQGFFFFPPVFHSCTYFFKPVPCHLFFLIWVSPRPKGLYSSISSACLFGWWLFSGALGQKISPREAGLKLSLWPFFSSWHSKASVSSSFSGKVRRSHHKDWKREHFQLSFSTDLFKFTYQIILKCQFCNSCFVL